MPISDFIIDYCKNATKRKDIENRAIKYCQDNTIYFTNELLEKVKENIVSVYTHGNYFNVHYILGRMIRYNNSNYDARKYIIKFQKL